MICEKIYSYPSQKNLPMPSHHTNSHTHAQLHTHDTNRQTKMRLNNCQPQVYLKMLVKFEDI